MCLPVRYTFPTAASPSKTSFTLLLGFGCADPSAIAMMWMWGRGLRSEVVVASAGDG
jgi:hypothetical protein